MIQKHRDINPMFCRKCKKTWTSDCLEVLQPLYIQKCIVIETVKLNDKLISLIARPVGRLQLGQLRTSPLPLSAFPIRTSRLFFRFHPGYNHLVFFFLPCRTDDDWPVKKCFIKVVFCLNFCKPQKLRCVHPAGSLVLAITAASQNTSAAMGETTVEMIPMKTDAVSQIHPLLSLSLVSCVLKWPVFPWVGEEKLGCLGNHQIIFLPDLYKKYLDLRS